jgi:hypothetical protein
MSKDLLISMLRKGQTGEEILSILDMLAADDDTAEPTLEEVQF